MAKATQQLERIFGLITELTSDFDRTERQLQDISRDLYSKLSSPLEDLVVFSVDMVQKLSNSTSRILTKSYAIVKYAMNVPDNAIFSEFESLTLTIHNNLQQKNKDLVNEVYKFRRKMRNIRFGRLARPGYPGVLSTVAKISFGNVDILIATMTYLISSLRGCIEAAAQIIRLDFTIEENRSASGDMRTVEAKKKQVISGLKDTLAMGQRGMKNFSMKESIHVPDEAEDYLKE